MVIFEQHFWGMLCYLHCDYDDYGGRVEGQRTHTFLVVLWAT